MPVGGGSLKTGIPTGSARSRLDRMGTVRTGEAARARAVSMAVGGRGRTTHGGVIARWADGRGAPPGPKLQSTVGSAEPAAVCRRVRVKMQSERGETARGAGLPESEGADAVGSVLAVESFPCKVLVWRGACRATAIAAAGGAAEPLLPSEGIAETEAKAVLAVGETARRQERRSMVVTEEDTQATNLPEGTEQSSTFIRGPCAPKSRNSEAENGSSPKTTLPGRGNAPHKPTMGVGKERVRSSEVRMRKIRPSST